MKNVGGWGIEPAIYGADAFYGADAKYAIEFDTF